MTTEEFIQKARLVHGKKYDYSKVEYINSKTKVCIICSEHGEFLQIPNNHLRGAGCKKCGLERMKQSKTSNTEEFIQKAHSIHGNRYDYHKIEYNGSHTKVCIICPEHGEFWQTPYIHLHGSGCPKCNGSESERLKAQKEFVLKSILIHGNKYDYSKVEYKSNKIKVCIICPEHEEFWQTPTSHLRGSGCPMCNESHGEREIRKWLDKHNIEYIREKTFKELRGIRGRMLRFDFYLPKHNICIEFDGKQHREFMKKLHRTKERFETIQEHDKKKNEFCSKNGIKLVRIWQENGDFKKLVVY